MSKLRMVLNRVCLIVPLAVLGFSLGNAEEKKAERAVNNVSPVDAHKALFSENRYPSATTCRKCHPEHYRQWSVSPHAYSQISPVFNAMQRTVGKVTNGTNGDFCIRCHTPVGMNIKEKTFISNFDRHPTAREGITCVACHRVNKAYGKISGRLSMEQGDILSPVYGPTGNKELARVLENTHKFRVVTTKEGTGRKIHAKAEKFFSITTPKFCSTCHDVNLINGFRLEEAFSEFQHSPAAKNSVSCQDCHMGKVPGKKSGYDFGPAAVVGGEKTAPRKLTNHMFAGPDHSIVHPGIFPHNPDAAKFATLQEWLDFDYKAGWGTDEFEDKVSEDAKFPPKWEDIDDRYEAAEIIAEQKKLLKEYYDIGTKVLQAGYQFGDFVLEESNSRSIKYKVQVKNATSGHNIPTGFIAERLVFVQTTVKDKNGKVVFQSGDLDKNGDVRDSHSLLVHDGKIPKDDQLFSLQSLFLTRMIRGGEREQVLPVNYSPDPLPFVRPSTSSTILTGRPVGARIHRKGIRPLSFRWAKYRVNRDQLKGTEGPYKINVKLIAGMVPVHLIKTISLGGFEYGMTMKEVADGVLNGHRVLAEINKVVK